MADTPSAAADDELCGGPFDSFRVPDIWEKLRRHPETRQFCADSGYVKSIEFLRTATKQSETRAFMEDPRIMQSIAVLQGWGLSVAPEDLGKAEWLGQMPRRDAVQMPHLERAARHTTVAAAKDAGNAKFKEGEYSDALACWLRALQLHEAHGQSLDETTRSTLHSNSANALLKLKRPADALNACELALKAAPAGADVSKIHFRRAMAHEELTRGVGVTVDETAKQWRLAVESMRAALTAARSAPESSSKNANIRNVQQELKRMKDAEKIASDKAQQAKEQAVREARAEALRKSAGQALPDKASETSITRRLAPGYVRDIDLSHWASKWIAQEVTKVQHRTDLCIIQVTDVNQPASDIHASIKEKNQKRALFYDMSLVLNFKGVYQQAPHSGKELVGVFRLYNVGQDTRFCPGGDKETSYMYELGFDRRYFTKSEQWIETIKEEAGELFHLLCPLLATFEQELSRKADHIV
ncbi:hypothetical protein AB1Y20_000928 [Prymnesium parvum]|uniref:Uncharacterized protein n=1 Tax=Prymnesium parvum TaxID=97485 RepID=A0AB34IR73_PRYPA